MLLPPYSWIKIQLSTHGDTLALLPWKWSCENRNRPGALFSSTCQHVGSGTPVAPYFVLLSQVKVWPCWSELESCHWLQWQDFTPYFFMSRMLSVTPAAWNQWMISRLMESHLLPMGFSFPSVNSVFYRSKEKLRPCTNIDFIPCFWLLYPYYTWQVNLSLLFLFIYLFIWTDAAF